MRYILRLGDTDGHAQVRELQGERSIAEICAEAQEYAVLWGADACAELLCVEQSIDLLGAVNATRRAEHRAQRALRADRLRDEADKLEGKATS